MFVLDDQSRECAIEARRRSARVPLHRVDFGRLLSPDCFVVVEGTEAAHGEVFLNFAVRNVCLRLCETFCIEFFTREAEDFILLDRTASQASLYVTLRHPPRIYRQGAEDRREDLEFAPRLVELSTTSGPLLSRETFASCRTLRWIVGPDAVLQTFLGFLSAVDKKIYERQIRVQKAMPGGSIYAIPQQLRHRDVWEVQFAWLCLVSAPGFVPERFTAAFFELLNDCTVPLTIDVLHALTRRMNEDLFVNPVQAFDEVLKRGFPRTDVQDPDRQCRVPRLILTPTRKIFYEADVIQTNRVLREWGKRTQFLRVTVRDDNFSKLTSSKGKQQYVLLCIFDELEKGLAIGKKTFQFLGCSNNQVRDHGCFFVDATVDREIVLEIRSWAGNLEYIRNVAKYISRLGQIFSTSTRTVEIDPRDCVCIEDIEMQNFCFTDGIGKISQDLAKEVAVKLGMRSFIPCAFQIRFGGCKGVVAVDPELEKKHPNRRLCLRTSMRKYWSTHMTIEVLSNCSRPQELYLNQQLIMLLSHLGIKDAVFMKRLSESLRSLSLMFIDEEMARSKLVSVSCGVDWELLEQTNFLVTTDPYFRSMLMALYRLQMKGLREKSRIPVSPDESRILLGTVDETQTLEYGQVFVQISTHLYNPGVEKTILQRKIVVGKSPCLHPGDVRTFDAVDCPALHHMCDCIVFPSKGARPHPNELSGSDLDGDLYHVIWSSDLVPQKLNKEPMDYTAAKPAESNEDITSSVMLRFLRQTIEHDCLGHIDNVHKALADQLGIDSASCLKLASLHSQAVDAPKTGKWATIPSNIRRLLDKYPDFMMKQDKPSYPSEKVLGRMYRECTKFLNTCSIHRSNFLSSDAALEQSLLVIDGMKPFLEEARKLRRRFNGTLQGLMSMYGIRTEGELMSGFVEKLHEKIGKETHDAGSVLSTLKEKLLREYRNLFYRDERIQKDGSVDEEKAMCKAAAWHYVCYSPSEHGEKFTLGRTEAPFLSFAWIPSQHILKLHLQRSSSVSIDGVKACIGKSVYDQLQKKADYLLRIFDQHIAVKEHMEGVLGRSDPVFIPFLYGLSYAFLSDEWYPETELLLWFSGVDDCLFNAVRIDTHYMRQLIQMVRTYLHNQGMECRTVQSGKRQLLYFVTYVHSLQRWMKGHLAVDPLCWAQSALILEYIYNYPWLLPLLRVIVRWARSADLLVACKHSMDSLTLCMMVIDYGLRCGEIQQPIEASEVLERLKQSSFGHYAHRKVWEEILSRLSADSDCDSATPMGELLLGFFSDQENSALNPVHPSLVPVFGHSYYYQTCSIETTHLLQEEMQRAFHKLSFYGAIHPLFTQVETEKVIALAAVSAEKMEGSEEFFARLFAKQTHTRIEVHQKGRREGGLLIKITGTHTGISSVERLLDQFRYNVDARNSILREFPGVMELFLHGSHKCIIEGINSFHEKGVTLEDYVGPRYPTDDYRGIYVLRVLTPSESVPDALYDLSTAKFLEFKSFFLERLHSIRHADKESHSALVHGPLTLEISYGKFYLVCPPKEMMEAPEGISLAELRDFIDKDAKRYVQQPHRWKQEMESFSWEVTDASKDYLHSAFYPRMHPNVSQAALERLLQQDYGLQENDKREGYELLLRGKRHSVTAMYDAELSLLSVCYPPLHWMMVDIKRFYSERKEMDIHYDLASHAQCEKPEVLMPVSKALCPAKGVAGVPVVHPALMPCVEAFKQISRREFVFRGPEVTHFWRCATLVLREMTVMTRPKGETTMSFGSNERITDLRWVIHLEPFLSKSHVNDLIGEMWYQAVALSETLMKLAIPHAP